jgi:hypothetical protein
MRLSNLLLTIEQFVSIILLLCTNWNIRLALDLAKAELNRLAGLGRESQGRARILSDWHRNTRSRTVTPD